jgi:hypothetical protein
VDEQPIMKQQGAALQGVVLHGSQLQDMTLRGFRFAGATLNGVALVNLRLDKGELVAERNGVTLRGTALDEARIFAEAENKSVSPPQTVMVPYRIAAIEAEPAIYDPTGGTFLYTIEQITSNTGAGQLACPADSDGRRAAIPLNDTWDERGSKNSSSQLFTLGCTTGAIAKCYRWGYRPWRTGFGNVAITHWTCTRLARADYCGDGVSHTMDGTLVNVWDNLNPSPLQAQGMTPTGMSFEASWNQSGALCLSHTRWSINGAVLTAACSNRLRPPNQPNATVCNNPSEAPPSGGPNRMFNESVLMP